MKTILSILSISGIGLCANAQIVYVTPTHMLHTFTEVTNNTRAEALGKNNITLNGIRSAFDNPATISPGTEKVQVAANYFRGHPYYYRSNYYFWGGSVKIAKRITLGLSSHTWVDPKTVWSTDIAGFSTFTDKQAFQTYSLLGAIKLGKGLHLAASGNYILGKKIEGIITSEDFLLNAGFIYDKATTFLKKSKKANKENLRIAGGFTNALMKYQQIERKDENIWQYRDLPIIMRIAAAYGFAVPLNSKVDKKGNNTLELTFRLQYNNFIKHKNHFADDAKRNTLIGFGMEGTAWDWFTLRLGYFYETRPIRDVPTEKYATWPYRKGLTWVLDFNCRLKNGPKTSCPLI